MEDVMDRPTTSPISTRKHGDVLIVLSNNPPVNALSTAVRQGLVDAIAVAPAGSDRPASSVNSARGATPATASTTAIRLTILLLGFDPSIGTVSAARAHG